MGQKFKAIKCVWGGGGVLDQQVLHFKSREGGKQIDIKICMLLT